MSDRNFKVGQNRYQSSLLPPSIDDYVSLTNPVRAIDAYVDTLTIQDLKLANFDSGLTAGQPAYHPSILIKLYLYGYLNSIRSSRKLEREAARNLEVIWLTGNLKPSYKTIANFRKDNPSALKTINKDFILLCRQLNLFKGDEIAIDGSFFNADASKSSIYTDKQLQAHLDKLQQKIDTYHQQLVEQDAQDDKNNLGSLTDDLDLAAKIEHLKKQQAEKQILQAKLKETKDSQISTVDPDARLLTKRGKTTAGYNVQIAVDSQHKLIVATDVTQEGNDTQLFMPMLEKAQEVLQSEHLIGLADAGYYSSLTIKNAHEKEVEIYIPIPVSNSSAEKSGCFSRDKFIYDPENDIYKCPNNKHLERIGKPGKRKNRMVLVYRSKRSSCKNCPIRSQCITDKATYKNLERSEDQNLIDQHRERMKNSKKMMIKRSSYVEHPFGTLKHRAGINHFLMRGLEKCTGEFNLMVLAYNFTRVLNTIGIDGFKQYCTQRC